MGTQALVLRLEEQKLAVGGSIQGTMLVLKDPWRPLKTFQWGDSHGRVGVLKVKSFHLHQELQTEEEAEEEQQEKEQLAQLVWPRERAHASSLRLQKKGPTACWDAETARAQARVDREASRAQACWRLGMYRKGTPSYPEISLQQVVHR